jgi:hypothetical protein
VPTATSAAILRQPFVVSHQMGLTPGSDWSWFDLEQGRIPAGLPPEPPLLGCQHLFHFDHIAHTGVPEIRRCLPGSLDLLSHFGQIDIFSIEHLGQFMLSLARVGVHIDPFPCTVGGEVPDRPDLCFAESRLFGSRQQILVAVNASTAKSTGLEASCV